jgi:deoxyribodipyrimidine photo-lyase
VVPSGEVEPTTGDHYKVFTPFWRAWSEVAWRGVERAPTRVELPDGVQAPPLERGPVVTGTAPERPRGGFEEGERLLAGFLDGRLADYPDESDQLARDGTSRLSPHLHFGTVSPRRAAELAMARGDEAFTRQLCWRDFHHQVLRAFPALPRRDYRDRDRGWVEDDRAFEAWCEGRTGIPIVDAGMRQLLREGWMHNRARLIVASYLTKEVRVHWRHGAEFFLAHLADGDLANNSGNWQWVAGTGNDTRPNRRFNLLRQARRFDPDGEYVRRFVPELSDLRRPEVHEPWRLGAGELRRRGYPEPVLPAHSPDGASTIPGL